MRAEHHVLHNTVKLTRLRQRKERLPVVEVEPRFLFASMLLAHVERLPGVQVLSKCAFAMADSFEAVFEFAGHRFNMSHPFGFITIESCDCAAPRALLEALAEHIDAYHTVWPQQWLWALVRYAALPRRLAEYEQHD